MIQTRIAVLFATTLLLATGCSGEQGSQAESTVDASTEATAESSAAESTVDAPTEATAESSAAESTASATPSEERAPAVSLATTCEGMLLPAGGLVVEVSLFLNGIEDFDAASVDTAGKLDARLGIQAGAANGVLAPSIRGMQQPLQEFIQAAEGDRNWTLDAEAYKRAGNKVNDTCAEYVGDEPVAVPEPTPTVAESLSKADEISVAYPGYPLIVNVASLDYRVANWYKGKLVDGQVVALAPGLYSPFNPNVPDLTSYYESGSVDGDSALKDAVLPDRGGATWSGVLPGLEEPQ